MFEDVDGGVCDDSEEKEEDETNDGELLDLTLDELHEDLEGLLFGAWTARDALVDESLADGRNGLEGERSASDPFEDGRESLFLGHHVAVDEDFADDGTVLVEDGVIVILCAQKEARELLVRSLAHIPLFGDETVLQRSLIDVFLRFVSVHCLQCGRPSFVLVCLSGVSARREKEGKKSW